MGVYEERLLFLKFFTSPPWIGWSKSLSFVLVAHWDSKSQTLKLRYATQTVVSSWSPICFCRKLGPLLTFELFETFLNVNTKHWKLLFIVVLVFANLSKKLGLGGNAKISTGHPYGITYQTKKDKQTATSMWLFCLTLNILHDFAAKLLGNSSCNP